MHEVTELLGTHGFEERVLPVLIGNAGGMFDPQKRGEIKDFWKDKLHQKQALLAAHTDEDFLEEARKVSNIVHYLGGFFSKIKYLNAKTLDELKKENYQSLLKVVGIDKDHVLRRVIEIAGMDDEEEQDLALDRLHLIHPNNHFIWFQKSILASRQGADKKQKGYLELAIDANAQYSFAHNNLAILLTGKFGENEDAMKHFLEALHINPEYSDAHNNLAVLLQVHFGAGAYEEAKKHCLEALRIDPDNAIAHNNLAGLLQKHAGEESHEEAKMHYQKALRINPEYSKAHFNLALLLLEAFNDVQQAQQHYQKSIALNPAFKTNAHDIFFQLKK